MFLKDNYKFLLIYSSLVIIAFLLNFLIASRGLFPVDTFIHYDFGYRILLGDDPVKDYWIVHGFFIDYIQSFFFKLFGNNWYSYIIHSSVFNVLIAISSYQIFKSLKVNPIISYLIVICISILAYPVSGTPFLDLHSTYFSLLAIYMVIFFIQKNRIIFWFYTSIFLCLAFFSKQVPAAYTIIGISLINIYFSLSKKNIKIFLYYLTGAILFILTLYLFLNFKKIPLDDFILQIFLFPPSIGLDRYENYQLNFKNLFFDYKYIYFILIPIIILNFYFLFKKKDYYKNKSFEIFLILLIFVGTTLFHQIYTKNQIYIFSLIPILTGFGFYYLKFLEFEYKKYFFILILGICIFSTIKYHIRFNVERKFHELSYTQISNFADGSTIDYKLQGLKWITPYFENPEEEIDIIKNFLIKLKEEKKNKMLISEYNFFSSIIDENLYAPSRTYDLISYPRKNSKYYKYYKKHLIDLIKRNAIENIYVFEPYGIYEKNEIIFNYISKNCFKPDVSNKHFKIYKVLECEEFQ